MQRNTPTQTRLVGLLVLLALLVPTLVQAEPTRRAGVLRGPMVAAIPVTATVLPTATVTLAEATPQVSSNAAVTLRVQQGDQVRTVEPGMVLATVLTSVTASAGRVTLTVIPPLP